MYYLVVYNSQCYTRLDHVLLLKRKEYIFEGSEIKQIVLHTHPFYALQFSFVQFRLNIVNQNLYLHRNMYSTWEVGIKWKKE